MRNYILFFAIFTLAPVLTSAQNIATSKTSKHIRIPGTRVYLVPPAGFAVAKSFAGLQKGKDYVVMVNEVPDGNFYRDAASFTRKEFENAGMKVLEFVELKVNGYPAKRIVFQDNSKVRTLSMVLGDSTFSVMLTSRYESGDKTGEAQLRKAINSVYFNPSLKPNYFTGAAFSLDDSKSKYKFAKYTERVFVYTPGGIFQEKPGDEPVVVVMTVPNSAALPTDSLFTILNQQFALKGFKSEGNNQPEKKSINKYQVQETVTYGTINGLKTMMYVLVASGKHDRIVFQGTIKSDFEANLAEIRKLINTIRLK